MTNDAYLEMSQKGGEWILREVHKKTGKEVWSQTQSTVFDALQTAADIIESEEFEDGLHLGDLNG